VLERAQILAEDYVITLDDLPENIVENAPLGQPAGDPRHLREVERQHVLSVLKQEKGNKVHAAKALGISRRALYRLLDKYHLEKPRPGSDNGAEQAPSAQETKTRRPHPALRSLPVPSPVAAPAGL
jgi:DNA-binding NtrC family response regulator